MNILDQEIILEFFRANYELFVLTLFLATFVATFYLIPKVLWVSQEKKLMANVNERSSHKTATPNFGGVAFFITIILVLAIIQSLRLSYVGNHLIAAVTILFMVGLKDDLVVSTARVKLVGQVTAALFLVFSPELQINNLYGFLGIHEIHDLLGYLLKIFLVVAIINSYNLIDGIDGLASIAGIIISGVYAAMFYLSENPFFVLISISLTGILTAFLRYNFSRGSRKIFMGDSGSLVIGLIVAFLSLKILAMEPSPVLLAEGYLPSNRLLLLACILFLPTFDTLRVIIIRKISGLNPFEPDRNHLHHILLDLGLPHYKASIGLGVLNILIIWLFLYCSNKLKELWLLLLVVSIYAFFFFFFSRLKKFSRRKASHTHAGLEASDY